MRNLVIVSLLIISIGCASSPVPKNILPPERMQKVVYDLIRIDEFVNNFVIKDSTVDIKKKRSILYEQVFKVNQTSRKEFYQSYKYYQQHPDVQKGLYDSLYEKMNRQKIEEAKPKPEKTAK
ncbi:DUF4296 domain-containing protein [Segetibacter aerophilus]|uniref:DUF4296 domain-containing protein n=1 Tax=Segetibacter aerophilus TaxID=670293 RepID=A0A512BET6_9BACT|nr:DUF4296 domain-containing protein [Segetibacter aerophilus]GEO10405.1 hypothetical protein SAE01_29010 [Segetibacter aerophilus]